MINSIVADVQNELSKIMDTNQLRLIGLTLSLVLEKYEIYNAKACDENLSNDNLIDHFISAKRIEGCSDKTIHYYRSTIEKTISNISKPIVLVNTDDLRQYLIEYQAKGQCSKITIDNIRRILSSFFTWLEDEDIIVKSPIRRIKKIKTGRIIKETFTDEDLELLRDSTQTIRDLAMIDILSSTGMRIGELVKLDIEDIDFENRECKVLGKGNCERVVYFDARTKLHLSEYLKSREDGNKALFVSLNKPHTRVSINSVESRLKKIGIHADINGVHPHKFRRTMATNAIDRGMPIEQVQKLLGHVRIDTTMHYALVNQSNIKISHRKYLS